MRKIQIITLLICTVFAIQSCGDKVSKLKKEREELNKELAFLNEKLEEVNGEIDKLEPMKVEAVLVSAETMQLQNFEHFVDLQSSVKTDQDVMMYPEFAGTLKLYVREGQQVRAGQVIGEINDGGISQQLGQAKAQANLAQTAFKKQEALWKQNIGSEIQYLQSKTNAEAAQKQVAAIQVQLGRTKLKAPFSGTIDKVIIQNGQVVAPGMPIIQLVSLGQMKVEADVPENYISSVKQGSDVRIEIPNLNKKLQSKIVKVGSSINPSNRTFNIEIHIPNTDGTIKPNLMAKIKILDYKNPNAFIVPTQVVKQDAKNNFYVYTISKINKNEGVAKKTIIVKGKSSGNQTEVLMGLSPNDKVIIEGANNMSEGRKVKF
jgi:RND family efflux transporter MFP subunit